MPFMYPTAAEMQEIEPLLITRGAEGRVGLQIMPVVEKDTPKVRWSQKDNYYGLQALRGLDGAPTRVARIGQKIFEYEPGVFGEFVDFTETELLTRAGSVDIPSTPINIDDLILEADDLLISREWDRIEWSIWTLLTTGTISIVLDGPDGTQVGYYDTYPIQTYTATVPWATSATATPILNFQTVQQMGQAAGYSVDFGANAKAYMNQVTANRLLNNQNNSDLNGRRLANGSTFNNIPQINSFLIAQNLPQIVPYDQGYAPTLGSNKIIKFIPDGVVVVVGQRPGGAAVGNYIKTRNVANGFRPGSYRKVIDRVNGNNAEQRVPPNLEVHRGHNGGPAIYYPSAVVVMNV